MGFNMTDYQALIEVRDGANKSFAEMEANLNNIGKIVMNMGNDWIGQSNLTFTDALSQLRTEFTHDREAFNNWIQTRIDNWSQSTEANEQQINQKTDADVVK